MKSYKEFIITAEPFIPEIISGILWELDIDGVSEEVNCLRVFSNDQGPSQEELSSKLKTLVDQKMLFSFLVEENILENKNWNAEWEKTINVIKVTDRIVIKPTFRQYEKSKDEIVIAIDPKMSFGTGEHQTTKLMLMLIEKYTSKNNSVLDVGSGTAVLSIAALKLGAASAVAVDIDEWCLGNAKENAVLNEVENEIEILLGDIDVVGEREFDLVLANIQKNILMNISGELKSKTKSDGVLILSGLLSIDEPDIINHYKQTGFESIEILKMDEWIAIVLKPVD
ncbi:MAG: 50S ribosomal protein L11 methyltransferase [Ignavibacteriales bacterium]|nr:MAG: 50S ribosomal protein L11 methyltransferase [Ignavibacteriales bacterium]